MRRAFGRIFDEFGLPEAAPLRVADGGRLSRVSTWWLELRIRPERIAPARPEQDGRHERLHRTLEQETAISPASSLPAQQRPFDRFRRDDNQERPHEALGQQRPASGL